MNPPIALQRLSNVSRKDFARDFLGHTPVVLTEALTHWPALRTWSWEYLRERCGERKLPIEIYEDGNRSAMWAFTTMTLAQYMDRLSAGEQRKYYLAERRVEEVFPELLGDLRPHELATPGARSKQVVFLGRDSFSTLHYHPRNEALAVQVIGTKRFILYPPAQTEQLYPYPWYSPRYNFSSLPLDGPLPAEKYPAFQEAAPLEVTLRPGELLYIPVGWWHMVHGAGQNMTMTTFWVSEPRHWLSAPNTGWRDACNFPVTRALLLADKGIRRLGLRRPMYRLAEKLGLIDDASKLLTYDGRW